MPYGHRVGAHKIRTYPPIATIYVEFSSVAKWVKSSFANLSVSRIQAWFSEPSMWELRSLFRVIGLLHIIGLCSRASVTCSSALCSTLVCAVFRLVELLGPPTASLAYQARVYCGCKPGRVLPMPRQYGIGRRAPALRTLATSYDYKETWFIDVSSCTPPRPVRGYGLVDFGITSLSYLIHLFNHELLTDARRHVAWLCNAMSRLIQTELPWYCSIPQPHQHGPSSEYRNF